MQTNQTGIFYMGSNYSNLKEFPKEFKSSFFGNLDRKFLIILLVCAIIMGVSTLLLSLRPLDETATDEQIIKIQERYAQLVLNQPKPKIEKKVEKVRSDVAETGVKEEKNTVKKIDRKKETLQSRNERKEQTSETRRKQRENIQKKVSSSGIFAAITSTGGGGVSSSGVADLLGDADGIGDIGAVDVGSGTFATKSSAPLGAKLSSRRGTKRSTVRISKGSVGTASGTRIASAGQVKVSTKPPKMAVKSGGEVTSKACIQKTVNRQKRRLKRSFENWLKRDPDLSGQIKIRFVILPGGSVSNVSILSSTTNNPKFDQTIVNYIKGWKFLNCDISESVEIVYPFAFSGAT